MDTSSTYTTSPEPPHSLKAVRWLKIYRKKEELPVSGPESELVKRVAGG